MSILNEIDKGIGKIKNFADIISAGEEAVLVNGSSQQNYERVESNAAPFPESNQTAKTIAGVSSTTFKQAAPWVLGGSALALVVWLSKRKK